MKTSKRILSLLLVMVFILTAAITTPVLATFSDVDGTEPYAAAISSLNSLGIINGYEDGTFRPLNNVTRAEFTALLLRARGFGDIGSTDLNDPPYPDVVTSDVSWAIGNIRTAKDMGIVTGYEDGTFRPMNNVLYEEAITMIVRAIGYENAAAEGGEWYSKYLTIAGSIGLLKNVNGAINVPATRAVIAMMLDNLLNLEDESGYIQKTGIILSNRITSINSPNVDLRENEILIEDSVTRTATKYLVDDVKVYDEMMGQRVDFSYKENKETGYNEIKTITPRKSNVLEIKSKDIEDGKCDSGTIVYYEDGVKQKKVVISQNSSVIYNGKLYGTSGLDSKYSDYYTQKGLPVVGSLKLLDNDNDNKYDVVFVDSYDIYVVSNVTTGTRTITDKVLKNTSKILDYEKDKSMKFVDTKGYDSSFSSIVKGSVLCIKESNAANGSEVLTTVVINNTNPSGTVTGAKIGKSITLSSTTYNYSDAAPWVSGIGSQTEPQLDDSAKFYLDLNGDIVAYEKSQVQVNQKYGYISNYQVIEINMESVLKVTMFVPGTSGLANYMTGSKTKINGQPDKTPEEIKTILDAAAAIQGQVPGATNNACSQLIKFTATGNVLDDIITAEPSDPVDTLATDKLIVSKSFNPATATSKTTKSSKSQITSNVPEEKDIKAVIGSNTTLIKVPEDRTDSKGYGKMTTSQLELDTGYRVEVYDIKGSEPRVVVFYPTVSQNVNNAKFDTVPFIITELIGIGDNVYEVYGYNGKSETTLTAPLKSSPDSYSAFKALADDKGGKGYVVRFGKDADGNVTLDSKNIIFSNDSNLRTTVMSNHATDNYGWKIKDNAGCYITGSKGTGTTYEMIWGYVNEVGESYVEILADEDVNKNHIYTSYKDALVLKYEKAGGTFNIIKLEDGVAAALDTETTMFGEANPTEVFVYGTNGEKISIVIIKE